MMLASRSCGRDAGRVEQRSLARAWARVAPGPLDCRYPMLRRMTGCELEKLPKVTMAI